MAIVAKCSNRNLCAEGLRLQRECERYYGALLGLGDADRKQHEKAMADARAHAAVCGNERRVSR